MERTQNRCRWRKLTALVRKVLEPITKFEMVVNRKTATAPRAYGTAVDSAARRRS
jgi:hypothetical protein